VPAGDTPNNAAIQRALLMANSAPTSESQQLQIVNQQLALIHTELMNLVQNLASLGPVVTDYVASSTGNNELIRERGRRRLQNYTYRGPALPDPEQASVGGTASYSVARLQLARAMMAPEVRPNAGQSYACFGGTELFTVGRPQER
jgi:hypothetical protein